MGDMAPGDSPPGDLLPYELTLVMLVPAMENVEANDPLRPAEDTDDIDPWGMVLSRGVGEPLEPTSRRRTMSLGVWNPCIDSSPGGEEARRFRPVVCTSDLDESSSRSLRM